MPLHTSSMPVEKSANPVLLRQSDLCDTLGKALCSVAFVSPDSFNFQF